MMNLINCLAGRLVLVAGFGQPPYHALSQPEEAFAGGSRISNTRKTRNCWPLAGPLEAARQILQEPRKIVHG